VKLGKKRRKSYKRNYNIISQRVTIKAIIKTGALPSVWQTQADPRQVGKTADPIFLFSSLSTVVEVTAQSDTRWAIGNLAIFFTSVLGQIVWSLITGTKHQVAFVVPISYLI